MNDQRLQELLAALEVAAAGGPDSVRAWYDALSEGDRQLFDQEMQARAQAFIAQVMQMAWVVVDIVIVDTRYWQRRMYADMSCPYGVSEAGCLIWMRHLELGIAPRHNLDEADRWVSLEELMAGWRPIWEQSK